MIQQILNQTLTNVYVSFTEAVPDAYKPLITIAFYTLLIAIYSILMWKFYKFLARRDILELNLSQYNRTEHPVLYKFLAVLLYFLEYVIILPIIVFFWFSVFSVFILLLSEIENVSQILLISAAIVAATRMTAYYSRELSKDLAKLFPFTLLVVFLLQPTFFSIQRIITRFLEIPSLLNKILIYLAFIAALEILMRFMFTVFNLFSSSGEN